MTAMLEEDFTARLRRLMPVVVGGLGILLMVGGVVAGYIKTNNKVSEDDKKGAKEASVAGQAKGKTIKVDISGAVERPGVYEIPYDSRVADVLITAGGLGSKADRNYLSKNINLAQKLQDGMKVYIPFAGEGQSRGVGYGMGGGATEDISGLVNINLATTDQLDALPGIGLVTAEKVIGGRPYQQVSELLSRKIVTKSVYDKIKDKVTVY